MSNSTTTFKEGLISFYLPAIIVFLGIIAGSACISSGPFVPVGIAGIVTIITMVYAAVVLARKYTSDKDLKKTIEAEKLRAESASRKHAIEIARKNDIISELRDTIQALQKKIEELESEAATVKAVEKTEEEAMKEEEKPKRKISKRQK